MRTVNIAFFILDLKKGFVKTLLNIAVCIVQYSTVFVNVISSVTNVYSLLSP